MRDRVRTLRAQVLLPSDNHRPRPPSVEVDDGVPPEETPAEDRGDVLMVEESVPVALIPREPIANPDTSAVATEGPSSQLVQEVGQVEVQDDRTAQLTDSFVAPAAQHLGFRGSVSSLFKVFGVRGPTY